MRGAVEPESGLYTRKTSIFRRIGSTGKGRTRGRSGARFRTGTQDRTRKTKINR